MDTDAIKSRLKALGLKQVDVSKATGLDPVKVSKSFTGVRRFTADEYLKIEAWLSEVEANPMPNEDHDDAGQRDYMPIAILPSFAGMGGGGNGEGDSETGLVPRSLVVNELRAQAKDLLLIDVRGDSMVPDFQHGDQILVDCRDRDPIQPGVFALWDGDAYVIKLVERVPQRRGFYRVFSANARYSAYEVNEQDIRIMGRPVWFARRL